MKSGAAFEEDSASPIPASESASLVTSPSRDIGNAEEYGGDNDGKEDDGEDVADFEGLAEKLISAAEADDKDDNEGETTTLQHLHLKTQARQIALWDPICRG